jgi:hypothetical protein
MVPQPLEVRSYPDVGLQSAGAVTIKLYADSVQSVVGSGDYTGTLALLLSVSPLRMSAFVAGRRGPSSMLEVDAIMSRKSSLCGAQVLIIDM